MSNVIPFPVFTCLYDDSPVYQSELCESCFYRVAIAKSIDRHIRKHLRQCRKRRTCFICIAYSQGYGKAIDYVASGY